MTSAKSPRRDATPVCDVGECFAPLCSVPSPSDVQLYRDGQTRSSLAQALRLCMLLRGERVILRLCRCCSCGGCACG